MKGKYHFKVSSKTLLFEFDIKRNITFLQGKSATGKTTLLEMLYQYLMYGRGSGYAVETNANFTVYLRHSLTRTWEQDLSQFTNTIIFIEENNNFVKTSEFTKFVKTSGNYFVFVNRKSLKMLPYSVTEIYNLHSEYSKNLNKYVYTFQPANPLAKSGLTTVFGFQYIERRIKMKNYYSTENNIVLTFSNIEEDANSFESIRFRFERANKTGFDYAEGLLPDLIFNKIYGFSEDEIFDLKDYLRDNSFLIWEIAKEKHSA